MWKEAISLSKLQENTRQTETIDGNKILFIWHNDNVHAVQSQCPHLKLPLAKGEIKDECTLVCPFHKSAFDLKTGEVKCWSPWPLAIGSLLGKLSKQKELRIYPTRIENDQIYVKLSLPVG